MTVEEIKRSIIQQLKQKDVSGIALLEPLHFGARRIISQIETELRASEFRASSGDALIVRLVPKPNTDNEQQLYGGLYRDLHAGLRKELGQALDAEWESCFVANNHSHMEMIGKKAGDLTRQWETATADLNELKQKPTATYAHERLEAKERILQLQEQQDEAERQLALLEQEREQLHQQSMNEETLEMILTRLLEGPVAARELSLILIIEGLSQIAENHLQDLAWMMSRLTGQFPLKLLAWGGRELHELCSGGKQVNGFSPFQQLKQIRIPALSRNEINQLLERQFGHPTGGEALYGLTHGHPALVYELIEREEAGKLLANNADSLHAQLLNSEHLKLLRRYLESSAEVDQLLQRLLDGDQLRYHTVQEDHLYWLGIIGEHNADHWCWTAPVLADWARHK